MNEDRVKVCLDRAVTRARVDIHGIIVAVKIADWANLVNAIRPELSAPSVPNMRPMPEFEKCGNCGASAVMNVFWDPGDGWTCTNCWATDGSG